MYASHPVVAGHMLNCKQAHVVGKFAIDHQYLNFILSQNYCFVRSNPFSTIGSTNNQFDTLFSRFLGLFYSVSFDFFVNESSEVCLKCSYIVPLFLLLFYFLVLKLEMS